MRATLTRLGDLQKALDTLARRLAESEARFRDVIERNADAQIIVDREGAVCFANSAAARLFGVEPSTLVGTPFGFPVVAGETTEVDIPHNGAPRVAEMRVDATEWDGSPAFIASLRDITERRRAERVARHLAEERAARAAAEEAAHRFSFLLNTTTLLTSSLDYREKPRQLARLCVEELADWAVVYGVSERGQPSRLAVAHRDPEKRGLADELCAIPIDPKGIHPVLEVVRSRKPQIATNVTPDMLRAMAGHPRELAIAEELGVRSYMSVPIATRNRALGAIAFVSADEQRAYDDKDLALAQDVANRAGLAFENALLHEQVQTASRRQSDFLAVVSHDLRTPLNAIMGYADLLQLGVPEPIPQSAHERVDRMRAAARHLLYLLNELLAYARLEAGHDEPQIERVALAPIFNDIVSVAEPLAAQKGLRFVAECPPTDVQLNTDPNKLRQILLNLVGNAVKYTTKGEVRLSVRCDPSGEITFSVSDTGIGVAREHLDKIFEPFWQVNRVERNTGGGAGLGLSLVKQLSAQLGATVSVRSRVGTGSVFEVSLRP